MNTLKFLAVGSSLDAGREVVGRYRVREAGLLPRFEPEPATARASWWRRLLSRLRSIASAPPATDSSTLADSLKCEPAASARPDAVDATGADGSTVVSPVPAVAPMSVQAMSAPLPKPLQREFRFESVTVVCNDLHDADFEIVPAPRQQRGSNRRAELREVAAA